MKRRDLRNIFEAFIWVSHKMFLRHYKFKGLKGKEKRLNAEETNLHHLPNIVPNLIVRDIFEV